MIAEYASAGGRKTGSSYFTGEKYMLQKYNLTVYNKSCSLIFGSNLTRDYQFLTFISHLLLINQNMFKKKTIGAVALIVGILGAAISFLSDIIGITSNENFGMLQLIGVLVGVVLIILGVILLFSKKK